MTSAAASRLVLARYSEEEVTTAATEALREAGGRVSCAFVFASADYRSHLPDFLELIQLHGHVPTIIGSSGTGLIGTGAETERATGFSLLFLNLPDTEIIPCEFSRIDSDIEDEETSLGEAGGQADAWITILDPLSVPVDPWLDQWNDAFPGVPCLGGLASGGPRGYDIFLMHNREIIEGGVALGFRGGVRIDTIVSQGCRPIGEPLTITGAEENFVTTLGSRPAYEALEKAFAMLPEKDKPNARGNLFAGIATSEYVDEFKTGDFLVRNILGADVNQGVLALGAFPRVGQTLQFQLRDRASADADLQRLTAAAAQSGADPFASLVFACNGRGRNLFGVPNHDAAALAAQFGKHPSAGIFCNGEIGPVGGRNFVHGYTASIALFSQR
jgi:small ligand-binding sensory domain FIST